MASAANEAKNAVIFHNPKCSTSRKTLELLREGGLTPEETTEILDAINDMS